MRLSRAIFRPAAHVPPSEDARERHFGGRPAERGADRIGDGIEQRQRQRAPLDDDFIADL